MGSPAGCYNSVHHSFLAQRMEGSDTLFEMMPSHRIGRLISEIKI